MLIAGKGKGGGGDGRGGGEEEWRGGAAAPAEELLGLLRVFTSRFCLSP